MSKLNQLLHNYKSFISLPWRDGMASDQRVIFCVYPPEQELQLRAKYPDFELATRSTGHGWLSFDVTDTFARWIVQQRYVEEFFEDPEFLEPNMPLYKDFIVSEFKALLARHPVDGQDVVAVTGLASLFGFLKIRSLVEVLAPLVMGRLLLFFPGSYEGSNYRLLDRYDGWNYLAVPITANNSLEG